MFLFMGLATAQISNLPAATVTNADGIVFVNTASLLFIAFGFGVSLVINVWVFFRVSGALFNPAVSLALAVAGVIQPIRAGLLVVSQLLGGITAAALIHGLTPGPLNVGNRLGDGVSIGRGDEPRIGR
jgi:aquaporin rerated protein, other eukaryote